MKYLFIFIFTFFFLNTIGQNIKNHQWENRVLLIYSSDKNAPKLSKQLSILSQDKEGLAERKLVIYSFTKNTYRKNFEKNWKESNSLFKKFVNKKDNFTVWLLGLDGGVKLKQQGIISTQKLFAIIDGMPIRKRELNKQN